MSADRSAPSVDDGWAAVEKGDLSAAAATFRAVLAKSPSNPDAHYAYGYVLLKQGQTDEAKSQLCAALANAGSDKSITRDVNGLLDSHGLTCP